MISPCMSPCSNCRERISVVSCADAGKSVCLYSFFNPPWQLVAKPWRHRGQVPRWTCAHLRTSTSLVLHLVTTAFLWTSSTCSCRGRPEMTMNLGKPSIQCAYSRLPFIKICTLLQNIWKTKNSFTPVSPRSSRSCRPLPRFKIY